MSDIERAQSHEVADRIRHCRQIVVREDRSLEVLQTPDVLRDVAEVLLPEVEMRRIRVGCCSHPSSPRATVWPERIARSIVPGSGKHARRPRSTLLLWRNPMIARIILSIAIPIAATAAASADDVVSWKTIQAGVEFATITPKTGSSLAGPFYVVRIDPSRAAIAVGIASQDGTRRGPLPSGVARRVSPSRPTSACSTPTTDRTPATFATGAM